MPTLQLELNLWQQIQAAEADPLACDFKQLCLTFDRTIAQLSQRDRLQAGAEAIAQLADLLVIRAETYFEEWQQRFDPTGPILEEDAIAELVRQSFFLDLDDLISDPEPRFRLPSEREYEEGDSVVIALEKEEAIALAEEAAEGEAMVFDRPSAIAMSVELEHSEDVGAWIELVRRWMEACGLESVSLLDLCCGVELSTVEIWLAALLGGFALRQTGEFYAMDGVAIAL
jgi:hypothetical protein